MRLWPKGGLWRHSDFLKLWSAETISVFGSQFTGLALPLVAVLVLDASAFAVSALVVIEFLPFILFAIPAGVWVDRLRRKPILVIGDLARAGLLVTIPVAYALDALTLGHLYVVGFFVGICTVFFDVAYQSYLPSLVERAQLVEGNSKLEISRSTSQLTGPGAAGGIVSALGGPVAILIDSISFVVSAVFLFAIRKEEKLPEKVEGAVRPSMLADAREGLSFVIRNPYLRPISICTGSSNFFWSMGGALLVVTPSASSRCRQPCSASRSRSATWGRWSRLLRRAESRIGSVSARRSSRCRSCSRARCSSYRSPRRTPHSRSSPPRE